MSKIEADLVSTIIPVFNRSSMLQAAVRSVLAQSYRPIEIIIVDDGSNDETTDVVNKLVQQYPEIIALFQENAGPGVARENGRQHARGEFIQYLDSDDQLLPEKFSLQVAALHENQNCNVAYGKTDSRQLQSDQPEKAWKLTGEKINSMFPEFLKSRWWSTSTPLYRRSVIDKAGPWLALINEEDWEYDCRIAAQGGVLAYVDEFVSVKYFHDEHLSSYGGVDKKKLQDRCIAREHIFESASKSAVPIPQETLIFFSKSVFLLARQCAKQNMGDCVERMLLLANQARGGSNIKLSVFAMIGKVFGWRVAANIAEIIQ